MIMTEALRILQYTVLTARKSLKTVVKVITSATEIKILNSNQL